MIKSRRFISTARWEIYHPCCRRARKCSRIRRPEAEVSAPAFLPQKSINSSTSACAEAVDTTGRRHAGRGRPFAFQRRDGFQVGCDVGQAWQYSPRMSATGWTERGNLGRFCEDTRGLERVGVRHLGNVNSKRE